jgi:hypothetical protein
MWYFAKLLPLKSSIISDIISLCSYTYHCYQSFRYCSIRQIALPLPRCGIFCVGLLNYCGDYALMAYS